MVRGRGTGLLRIKMLRDIKRSLSAYFMSMVVVALGIMGYCTLSIAEQNLAIAKEQFYQTTRFAHGFASVVQAPLSSKERIRQLWGIEEVSARTVGSARMVDGSNQHVELRLSSMDFEGISSPLLLEGRLPEPSENAIVVTKDFFFARGLSLGDTITLSVDGKEVKLEVTGYVQSPETVYLIKNMLDMLPDPKTYGAAYLRPQLMECLYNMSGLVNEFAFTLRQDADFGGVKKELEHILEPYGLQSLYARKDHVSFAMLNAEMEQLKKMKATIPVIFLGVSAIMIYITLRRLIEQQRPQIGTLQAMGMDKRLILRHYLSYGITLGGISGAVGGILGYLVAAPMTQLYLEYFSLPGLVNRFSPGYLFSGIIMSVAFCTLSAYGAVKSMLKIKPAEAMRPKAPKSARKTWVENLGAIMSLLTMQGRMALRNLFRNRRRTIMTIICIAVGYTIITTLVSLYALIDVFIFDYFTKQQRQDIKITFTRPVLREDAMRISQLDGIINIDTSLDLPVKMKSEAAEKESVIVVLPKEARLYRIYDSEGRQLELNNGGMLISVHLANSLKVSKGDWVEVKITYPIEKTFLCKVGGLVPQYMGSNAYMSYDALGAYTGLGEAATSIYIDADSGQGAEDMLREELFKAANVSAIEERQEVVQKYRDMLGSVSGMMYGMAIMGVAVGFAVVYTSSVISFEEVKRELVIMKMLGMRTGDALQVISFEQWLLSLAGIILGIPLTVMASRGMAVSMVSDLYSIPDFVSAGSLFMGVICTLAAVFLGSVAMYGRVKKLKASVLMSERE